MDLLDSVMELLNGTPSPPINVVNHNQQVSMTDETAAAALLTNNSAMEAPPAASVVVTSATAPPQATANQSYPERNLALKLPLLSSSSSDSESENPTSATAGSAGVGDGERASSPPPNCAICLGRCKNKCFTDSCMHQFCFKCLCEWSKVKPECPLCKQTFKSIIHNVKSIHQFEEYHVQPPTVQLNHPPFEMDFQEMRIFGVVHPGHNRNAWNESAHRPFFYSDFSSASPYSSSSNTGSISSASGSASNGSIVLSNQYVYRGELLDLYRQDHPGTIANSSTLSQLWRRYVYDRKLYAMPVADITGRFRESSARFYRDNPSQIHRLMPWINRDIVCLLRHSNHDVTTVLESINSALTLMNILSPAFRRRLQPYLGNKTAHFIHELNNFARSPYDMIGYDRAVQYSPQTNEEIVIEFTSSDESTDNEHIDVAGDGSSGGGGNGGGGAVMANTSSRSSRAANAASTNAINLTIHNRLTSSSASAANAAGGGGQRGNAADIPDDVSLVIDLRGESDNNETISTGQATINSSNGQIADGNDVMMSNIQAAVAENIELTSGSSDECEFILERKPPHLRTPEMVSLDSESDSDVVFVDESKPLNKTLFSSSDEERHDTGQRDAHNHQHNTRNSAATSTRSKITALVEAKKRNHSENVVKSETQDSQLEIFNMGASTSAALRLSIQKRNDKSSKRSDEGRSRRLRREKYSLRNYERPTSRKRGKHLDSETSHSSTSTNSSTSSTSSLSDSSTSTDFSTSSSDEDYVANLSLNRRTSTSARADSSTKRHKTRKTKKRKSNSGTTSHSRAKRDARKRKMPNSDNSSDADDANKDHNGQSGKNFALIMAMYQNNKRCKNPTRTTRGGSEENESEGENSWRLKAVNEPLRRQQQQQQQQQQQHIKNSHKSVEQKRHRKNITAQDQTKQLNHVYREKAEKPEEKEEEEQVKDKHNRKRSKSDKRNMSDKETAKPQKDNKFNYDDTSSDESDNINLIELKSKLTGQDNQNKEAITDTTPHEQETATATATETLNNDDVHTTNNTNANSSNDKKRLETDTASTTVATKLDENLEASATIPDSDNVTITNETENNLPSTSHSNEMTTATTNLTAITAEQNNLIESILKNDLNASDDSNAADDGDNDQNQINHNHSNGSELNTSSSHETDIIHNDNPYGGGGGDTSDNHGGDTSDNNQNHNLSSIVNNRQHLYQSDISEDGDDDDDNDDDEDDNDGEMSSKTNPNSNLNVFPDATSMSATTTDTILHDAAEQISSAAVNFYNPQQHQQQPFNTADFADENSTNTSSSTSDTSLSTSTSTSSSSSSSSSISSSYNANVFMNFKNV